jgi:hypothetical protein
MIKVDDAAQSRKLDVRLYTYDGRVLLAAARLYQGQTTNFQTPGGGFAPVFVILERFMARTRGIPCEETSNETA